MKIQQRIKNLGESSQKYGPCEVCKKWCDSVYLKTVQSPYPDPETNRVGFAHVSTAFGHKECLEGES